MKRAAPEGTVVIVADPPWPHANGSRTNSGKSPKYPLMNLREIAALGAVVREIAGDNAVLYLWATAPHLPGAFDVMEAWGFTYRSFQVWRKSRVACGFWVRSNGEPILIGERGRAAAPPASLLLTTVVEGAAEDNRHSSKPPLIHETVERLWPAAVKVELFARRHRAGWHCFGLDLGHLISSEGVSVTRAT